MIRAIKGLVSGAVLSILLFFISIVHAGQPAFTMPATIDITANYLFFFHNYYVEINGPDGDCRYADLLHAFADEGVVVVSELRTEIVSPVEYAGKAIQNIHTLLKAGVPPENITISGHSKGAVIALQIAALLQEPEMRYIILAGCDIKPLAHVYPDPSAIKGNFLSLYANSDKIAGSCDSLLSPSRQGVSSREIVLESPEGHRLFFKPNTLWLTPVGSIFDK